MAQSWEQALWLSQQFKAIDTSVQKKVDELNVNFDALSDRIAGLTNTSMATIQVVTSLPEYVGKYIEVYNTDTGYSETKKLNDYMIATFFVNKLGTYYVKIDEELFTVKVLVHQIYTVNLGLSKDNWKGIQTICKAGLAKDYFELGETFNVELLTGEILPVMVVDIDQYTKNRVTFMTTECMAQLYKMNVSRTSYGGWEGSNLRRILNEEIFFLLPEDLQKAIQPREYVIGQGYTTDYYAIRKIRDKLWLPSGKEMYNLNINRGEELYHKQFQYYTTNYRDKAENKVFKDTKNKIARAYWVHSPSLYNAENKPYYSNCFYYITANGVFGDSQYADVTLGVIFCFEVGGEEE